MYVKIINHNSSVDLTLNTCVYKRRFGTVPNLTASNKKSPNL